MTNERTIAEQFAQRLVAFRASKDDDAAMRAAQLAIIDTIAVTLLGSRANCADIARNVTLLSDGGQHSGPCSVFGCSTTTSALDAAMLNGIASHADDFDDFTDVFGGHPSVPVLPAVFALGELHGRSGADIMRAYIAGVEIENRIANGVHFHHYEKGWHPTSTLGVFGAAGACAHLLALDTQQTAMALAIAASFASGIKANFGSMTKPLHVGHCARSGLQAALLAHNGFTAKLDAFEHPQGFFEVYNGAEHYDVATMFAPWFSPSVAVTPGASIKQFPCCGSTHPAIYMAMELRDKHRIAPDSIDGVEILASPKRLPHTHNPRPTNGLQAKFSIQYVVARALCSGAPRLADFANAAINDPRIRALLEKISVAPDPTLGIEHSDNAFGAQVTIKLRDGVQHRARTEHLPGRGGEYPMTLLELREKFDDCATHSIGGERGDALFATLERVREIDNFKEIATATRAAA